MRVEHNCSKVMPHVLVLITSRNCHTYKQVIIDLFTDTAALLISIVLNSYYGMPKGQININLSPEHPIMSFETKGIKMAAVSAKRAICDRFLYYLNYE